MSFSSISTGRILAVESHHPGAFRLQHLHVDRVCRYEHLAGLARIPPFLRSAVAAVVWGPYQEIAAVPAPAAPRLQVPGGRFDRASGGGRMVWTGKKVGLTRGFPTASNAGLRRSS
jgi:hypothetical protein